MFVLALIFMVILEQLLLLSLCNFGLHTNREISDKRLAKTKKENQHSNKNIYYIFSFGLNFWV